MLLVMDTAPTTNRPIPVLSAEVTLTIVPVMYRPPKPSPSLPMSKLLAWGGEDEQGNLCEEAGVDAAARAAAEWLGATFEIDADPLAENISLIQSDRNGVWNNYHFFVHELSVERDIELVDGAIVQWLPKEEIINHKRRPISPTARHLLRTLMASKLV